MTRKAIIERNSSTGRWTGYWEGEPGLVSAWTEGDCAAEFCKAGGLDLGDFTNREGQNWTHKRISSDRWEFFEREPKPEPRQARIDILQLNCTVGWWLDRPAEKVEGRTTMEVVEKLAALIGLPPETLALAWFGSDTGWKLRSTNTGWELIEVLPDATGQSPCPDCRGSGQYVGFLTVEKCARCQGRRMVAVQAQSGA